MYKLIKILNARTNVPETVRMTLEEDTAVMRGTAVCIKDGILSAFTEKSTMLPTHVVLADANGKEILCYAVTPDMVFEIPVSVSPADMKVGTEYLLTENGSHLSATVASGSLRGAHLMNKNGASQKGDTLLVSFR